MLAEASISQPPITLASQKATEMLPIMTREFPPLTALRTFESASRHTSFSRASNELSVSTAAVSQQIKRLEQWLGIALFERSANGVMLTHAGRDYAARIGELFQQIARTSRSLRERRAASVVSIRAQSSFASLWLVPKLSALKHALPHLEVRLDASLDMTPDDDSADLTISQHPANDSGPQPVELLRCLYCAYASPALAGLYGPVNVLNAALLHTIEPARGVRSPNFNDWFRAADVSAPRVLPGMHFNLLHLTALACAEGAGVALLPDALCRDSVQAGRLRQIEGPALFSKLPYYLNTRPAADTDVEAVRNWLLAAAVS